MFLQERFEAVRLAAERVRRLGANAYVGFTLYWAEVQRQRAFLYQIPQAEDTPDGNVFDLGKEVQT